MLLLVALAAQAANPPSPPVVTQATASIRIERPAVATGDQWDRLPPNRKRAEIVRDEQGRPVLLQIVENE
jgi:hypothetical protein